MGLQTSIQDIAEHQVYLMDPLNSAILFLYTHKLQNGSSSPPRDLWNVMRNRTVRYGGVRQL